MAHLSRARFVKLVKEAETGKYQPTINDVIHWYDILNRQIFKGELPHVNSIKLHRSNHYWGECVHDKYVDGERFFQLNFSAKFNSFKHFIEVLVHEMVHIWECVTYGYMGHGEHWASWKPKLKKFGLDLQISTDVE
jgi:hypothetical protein